MKPPDPRFIVPPRDEPGLVGELPPLVLSLLPDEAAYVARLVAADFQRMTENRDHGVSHGMRGYAPPDLETAGLVLHSLEMARTSAAVDAIEAIEDERADRADLPDPDRS